MDFLYKLDKKREAEIQSCFYCALNFYYLRNREQFEELFEYFKTKTNPADIENDISQEANIEDINYGEKKKRRRLIIADDVSGLADNSVKFANFLAVARKFGYHCLYIFHAIHPEKAIWRTIYLKQIC